MKKYNLYLDPEIEYNGIYDGGIHISLSQDDCCLNAERESTDGTVWFCHAEYAMGLPMMQILRRKDRGAAGICMLNRNELLIDPFAQDIFKNTNIHSMPVMIKLDSATAFKDNKDLSLLEHCLQDYPETDFIVGGRDFWRSVNHIRADGTGTLEYLLNKYKNLYGSLNGIAESGIALNRATEILNNNPDRFFFANDFETDENTDRWFDRLYFMGGLTTEAYEKIWWENAEKLIKSKL